MRWGGRDAQRLHPARQRTPRLGHPWRNAIPLSVFEPLAVVAVSLKPIEFCGRDGAPHVTVPNPEPECPCARSYALRMHHALRAPQERVHARDQRWILDRDAPVSSAETEVTRLDVLGQRGRGSECCRYGDRKYNEAHVHLYRLRAS